MNFGMKNQETDTMMVCEMNDADAKKKRSIMQKQKIAAFALAICILFLGVAIAVANHFVGIYYIRDEYVKDNQKQSDRYTVKRENGAYKMFNRDGKLMELVPEHSFESSSENTWYNVYIAENSGNQYLINSATGEYELYAVVDCDDGEVLGGTAKDRRVMIFPRVSESETYSIRVSNQYGSYELYRQNELETDSSKDNKYTTTVKIRGTEATETTYDSALFSSLCVSCGYPLSLKKLDFNDPETPRDNGQVRYSDYGLENIYDENGNLTYAPAVYTIVKGEYDADGYCSPAVETTVDANGNQVERQVEYTVKIGYPILSGDGYYAQMEGRDTVYILGKEIENTVLKSVEALVLPMVVYPMKANTYIMIQDFVLKAPYVNNGSSSSDENADVIASFSYVDVSQRNGSILTLEPYKNLLTFMDGYKLDADRVNKVMELLYTMEFLGCKKLNPGPQDLIEYDLGENFYRLSFRYDPKIDEGGSDEKDHKKNDLLISQRTEQGTYYIYSELYDMIVEVDESYLSFLNWETKDWYNSSFFQNDISYMKEMSFTLDGVTYDFLLDNSLSYAYYDKGDGTGERINLSEGTLAKRGDTYWYTVTKTNREYRVYHMDLVNGKTYLDTDSGKRFYIGEGNVLVEITSTHTNLQILLKKGEEYEPVDYKINVKEALGYSDIIQDKTYTAAENFRRLYKMLLYYSLEGDADLTEFEPDLKSYITQETPVAEIRYSLEDIASMLNPDVFEENHKRDVVIRFYEYPDNEQRLLLTIETLENGAEPNPANGQGRFFVHSEMLSRFAEGLEMFLSEQLLTNYM